MHYQYVDLTEVETRLARDRQRKRRAAAIKKQAEPWNTFPGAISNLEERAAGLLSSAEAEPWNTFPGKIPNLEERAAGLLLSAGMPPGVLTYKENTDAGTQDGSFVLAQPPPL